MTISIPATRHHGPNVTGAAGSGFRNHLQNNCLATKPPATIARRKNSRCMPSPSLRRLLNIIREKKRVIMDTTDAVTMTHLIPAVPTGPGSTPQGVVPGSFPVAAVTASRIARCHSATSAFQVDGNANRPFIGEITACRICPASS